MAKPFPTYGKSKSSVGKNMSARNWADAPNLRNPPSSVPMKPFPKTSDPVTVDRADQYFEQRGGCTTTGNPDPTRK